MGSCCSRPDWGGTWVVTIGHHPSEGDSVFPHSRVTLAAQTQKHKCGSWNGYGSYREEGSPDLSLKRWRNHSTPTLWSCHWGEIEREFGGMDFFSSRSPSLKISQNQGELTMPSPVTLRLSGSHKSCLFCRVLSSENYFGPHILFPRANKPSKHHKAPHPPELSPTSRARPH